MTEADISYRLVAALL